jgi:uncharacterized membrane protein
LSEFLERLKELVRKNPGATFGGAVGLLLGILIIVFGPVKTGILILCCAIGFLIGRRMR